MTHAVVTVEIDSKTRADLALPLEVPNHALANAIAQALDVDKSGKEQYSLAVKTEQGVVRLSPQSTLGDVSVLDGFYLLLYHERNAPSPPPKKRPYLQAESGQ
ncbi:MAG: EsaB/YukD family protein, partial [Chloroflexota bacterium]